MQAEKTLTPRLAAEKLGITPSLVCLYCREGRIKAKKIHGIWMMEPQDVERFAEKDRPRGKPKSQKN